MDLIEIVERLHRIRMSGKVGPLAESFALGFAEGFLYAEAQREQEDLAAYAGGGDVAAIAHTENGPGNGDVADAIDRFATEMKGDSE